MSQKIIGTLLELLDTFKIEVPIVQRDYAQGRQDEHSTMVRSNLLEDMKLAVLHKTQPLDLNFVYGKVEGDKFIPIDGQQRLTTLFLLHIYAFCDDDSQNELFRKFTYETRTSSRKFLEKLTDKRAGVFSSDLSPSKEIEDSEWFVSGWKYDPTIQSVLTMLDEIKLVFGDVDNLAEYLSSKDYEPIIFKFLEMKDLGMEDSLYIKLNARGKPLTPFETFKARLIGQLENLGLDLTNKFEMYFDGIWTDLFWSNHKANFDQTFLAFFGVLIMNKGLCKSDSNWSNRLDFEKIDKEIFETAFYTLNFLSNNPKCEAAHRLIFNALTERRTYPNRVLFHAVTSYMHMSKGIDNGSLEQWLRIIQNLTLNSRIEETDTYRRAIEGINGLVDNWDDLLTYFAQNGKISGFANDQIKEEQIKAKIILQDVIFANEIYKAEKHPYFSGQIRSALHYATDDNEKTNMEDFIHYWEKISALFDSAKPKHGHLLRRALLTFGDYTLSVSSYKTLCVDDPNEASRTPSLKQLFSDHGNIVKQLLDTLNKSEDIATQLKNIVKNSTVLRNDWRYCFIKFPKLFSRMSSSHLRLRFLSGEVIIIPNKSSSGYNYDVFLSALHELLQQKGLTSTFDGYLGTWVERYLCVGNLYLSFKNGAFVIDDAEDNTVFKTTTDYPITEVAKYLLSQ